MMSQTISGTLNRGAYSTKYVCPVCGFLMDYEPANYNICQSCGTEFGVNDVHSTIQNLREAWLQSGPKWWNPDEPAPDHWNPAEQLARLEWLAASILTRKPPVMEQSSYSAQGIVGWAVRFQVPGGVILQL